MRLVLPYCVNLGRGFLGFSKPLRDLEDHLKLEREKKRHFLHKPLFLLFLYLGRVVHSWEERENRQTYILRESTFCYSCIDTSRPPTLFFLLLLFQLRTSYSF